LGRVLTAVAVAVPLFVAAPTLPVASVVQAVEVAPAPAGATSYRAITPDRLADMRTGSGYTWVDSRTIRVQVAGRSNVPLNAQAAVLNVVLLGNATPAYLTVYPAGFGRPEASNVNADLPNQIIANMVTVQLGVGGAVDIFMQVPMQVVVDVSGAYVPTATAVSAGRLVTRSDGAFRVIDTRDTGTPLGEKSAITVDTAAAGVPPNASAVVVNITAVWSGVGFWTAAPLGADPRATSTLNIDFFLQTRAAQAIVMLTPGSRAFQVYSLGGGNVVVDVAGWFTGDGDTVSTEGLFLPRSPLRVLDTRRTQALAPWGGSTFEFGTANPIPAAAVAVNLTGTESWDDGFVTAYPAGQVRPFVSNLNFLRPSNTVANHAIVRLGQRGLALYTQKGAHLIADVAGWYTGPSSTSPQPVPSNPGYWPGPAQRVVVPKLGLNIGVATGSNLDAIADRGLAATYPEQITVPQSGNLMLFGHRTSAGGPFRYINTLVPGDAFSVIGWDGRSYNYRVTRLDVVGPSYLQVQQRSVGEGPITAQLVACHPPGSVSYRIVVTGRLISIS
jgi:sortase (surface protein transpeptidase)